MRVVLLATSGFFVGQLSGVMVVAIVTTAMIVVFLGYGLVARWGPNGGCQDDVPRMNSSEPLEA